MADHHHGPPNSGLPLDQYTKSVPPGWKPGLTWYPFKRFVEKFRLFYRLTDLDITQIGPAVAGRLQGRPEQLAMRLQCQTSTGVITGDDALAYTGEPHDPLSGTGPFPSGVQTLLRTLQAFVQN